MQQRYRRPRNHWRQRTALAVAVAACFAGNAVLANPTGPAVVHGQATFAKQGNTLTVTNAPGTVINWQGFSIAGNEIARFIQQSQSSSVLNRVVGINPSAILGTLQSNGRVFLVNPNGITIGPGANIDVAGFLASTLNLSDADFLAGRMRFTQIPGAGSVVNHGTISTSTGGMVYLVGHDVQNSGIIRSPQGEILLAAGKSVELVDAQTPEVRVQLTAPDNQTLNLGQLVAAGGRIGMYGTLVRHSGVASANAAVMGENGRIVFKAVRDVTLDASSVTTANGPQGGSVVIQAETGSALVSGAVTTTGYSGAGGMVQVLGNQVGLFDGAGIDVSGRSGGGTALIGGDFQGSNADVQNASRTFFGAAATIAADAVETGNGGKVILWSDDVTRAFGSVTARGGAQSGNGGFVEISGKQSLAYSGTVNTLAPFGTAGLLLLDPADLDIVATGNLDVSGTSPFAPLGGDGVVSTLGWDTITGAGGLGGGNVVITTVGTPAVGSETGRIRIQASGTYTSANTLTIDAAGAIEVNATVTNNGTGVLALNAQGGTLNVVQALTTTGGAINLTGSGGISLGANLSSGGGAIDINGALAVTAANPLLTAGAGNIGFSSTVDGGTNSLTTNNTGTLSFGGAISNMANLTIQAGPSSVALPQTTLSGNLSLSSAGNVTQTGVLAVTGPSGITSTGGNVTLDDAGNNFDGLVTAFGADISLRDTNVLNAAISATGAGVLQAGDNLAVSGSTGATLQTTTTGTGTTSFGVTSVGSNLIVSSAAGVGQNGKLTVTGTSGITASSGDIALAGFSNSLGSTVTASASGAGVVALRNDATPLVLGNVSTGSAGLGLYLNGDVSQAGGTAITAGGPVYVEANAAGVNVALASATNDFNGGLITLATVGPGTYTNVSVRDTDGSASIAALPANIGGNLTLQFDNAEMTVPGVTVGGNVQLIAGGTVNVSGNVSSTGTAALTTTAGNIALGADFGSTGAATTLTSAGNITQTTGTVSGTDVTLDSVNGVGGGTGSRVATVAGNLAARSTSAGGVFVSETDAVTLNTLSGVANGAAGGGAYDVTVGGTMTVAASVNGGVATGATTLAATAGGNIALGAGVGNTNAATTLTSAGNITQTTEAVSGSDVILDSVTGVGGGAGARVATAAVNLAARSTTSGGVFVSESDAVTLTTLSGVANAAAGGGAYDVAAGGNLSIGAAVSGGLVHISAAGTIADSAQITGTTLTTSSEGGTVLDFGHAVTGFNATNITGGNIQLVNSVSTLTVTGVSQNGGGDVFINNTGALTINGTINNAGTGGAINLTGSTGINLNQNLTATDGNITLDNAAALGANVQIAAGTGTVTLTGATGIGTNNLTVSSSGVTTIAGGITGSTGNVDIAAATRTDVDGAIVLSGAGTVQLDRAVLSGVNVTTAGGNITFDGVATTDTGPLQVGSGGGNVLFNNTLVLGTGAGLTVLAGAGATTFTGAVDGPAGLAVTASGNTVFSSAVGAGIALASLATDGGGLTQLNGGSVTTTGGQTYSDAATQGADTTLAGAGITFSSTLNSAGVARTLQINDSGSTTFSAAVGNTLALASLTTNTGGATGINGSSVVTTGAQTYNDAVTLGANTTLTGVGITFNGTLNSAGAARTLQINDSGTTTFGGLVGNTLALASLATNTGGVTAINTTAINTTGAQTYNDAVTLGAFATLASSGGGNIRFVDTLDGSSGLIVNTAGNTIFSATVGGSTPLASLTTDAAGATQVNGGAVTTVGAQTYNDGVTIAGPTIFNATATTATLDFNATLAAATHALTLSADEINLAGGAGTVTGSGPVTLQSNNTAAAINVGSVAGATVGALDLAVADLAALANGFSAINLGHAAGTHAITIGNAAFQDTLLVRTPAGGSVNVSGALSSTENVAFNAFGVVQGGGSITAPRVTIVAGGIGNLATPLQLDTPDLDVQNNAGNAVMANAGPVSLLNNFRNTATGGELRLIANNGAINTGAVAVQSAGGRIALIANDTTGGATGNVIVGGGGIASAGGDIALHAADNITVNGAITAGAGNVRMLAGTGPGINAAHASFTGANPQAPTELATDDFGFITFNAPVSAANMVLVSSTSATPTVVDMIIQTAAGSIATTGALSAVTLRGAGAPGNGGGTIDLNDASGNNSTGLINLFACSFDGCPNPLPTVPFVNQGAPVLPFTTAVYSDGQLFYSDVGGTNVTGIGTSGDFTLYTPGSVTITGPSLSAKNLTIEALVDINVDLLAPFTNNDINGGQPGGSLNFIAGQNVNYTSMVAGATIGAAGAPFNHDLRLQAAGNVTLANSIYIGAGNFVVQANQAVSLDGNTINIPATGTGSVLMQGNHVISSMGDLAVSGVNLTVQGGDTGSPNQSIGGQQLLLAGTIALNLTGDVNVTGSTATANSGSGALVRGAVVNVGSPVTPVANLNLTGGTSVVSGTTNQVADARIAGTTTLNVRVAGNVGITGGSATITNAAGSSQTAGASAILEGGGFNFEVAGDVTLTGGVADAATGGNTATANAQIVAHSAFSPVIQGDLNLVGGSATAQPIAGQIANAVAVARFESDGNLQLNVGGNVGLQGGTAVAINNSGGTFAEADASASVNSGAKVGINVGQNFNITGGSATATGSSLRAIASAGISTGDITAGESLLISTAGNMSLTGGTGAGAAADAAALIYSAAEAKLNISGAGGLRLEGGTGPFFPPFGSGVFTPDSDLFHMIGGNSLVRIEGSAYPITVTGLITVVSNPALGAALFISEAPPLSLDSLLAAFIKSTDCVSFSGGSCTLSGAVASGSGKSSKDPAGGVCK